MPLVLTLHRARDPADRQRESRVLDEGSLSIGRGPGNGWVLQDPAQYLSKTHCIVSATRTGFTLTDCSSNGVFLNGAKQRMPRDSQAAIGDGDEFTLGDYLIRASEVAELSSRNVAASAAAETRGAPPAIERDDPFGLDDFLAPAPAPAPRAPAPPPAAPAPRFDPFADPAQGQRSDPFGDGFDDLLGTPPPAARPFNEPAPRSGPPRPDPFEQAAQRDTQARPDGRSRPVDHGRMADVFGDDDDLFQGTKPAVNWQGPSQPDTVPGAAQAYIPPRTVPMPNMDDFDDLLGDLPPGGPLSPPAPAAPPSPPPFAAPAAPPVATPGAQPVVPGPAAPPPPAPLAAGLDAARLIEAFLDGAGVPGLDVSGQEPEAYMRAVGELFGTMVTSLREVLMSRAEVKATFGADQTMLRQRDNNALKFSMTPEDAVSALLQPGKPGYMAPMKATKQAFDDVRSHQMAVMAGVQAALFDLLRTFDPTALEARLQKGGMIESIMPATRRAKLWESFCATYKDIARDADSDFQAVFGREFARAYNEQVRSA